MPQQAAQTLVTPDLGTGGPPCLGRLDDFVPEALVRALAVLAVDTGLDAAVRWDTGDELARRFG